MSAIRAILLFILASLPNWASANLYQSSIEGSVWELQSSPFACRLSHSIPEFGRAILERGAGAPVRFWFEPSRQDQTVGMMRVYSEPPAWRAGVGSQLVSTIQNDQPRPRIEVSPEHAPKILTALENGMRPTLRVDSEERLGKALVVGASPANFPLAHKEYLDCVAQLLPVNYEQIARTAILYPPAQWELSNASRERLRQVQEYLAADREVQTIYIDGHSDSAGRRLINRDLSKKRAEAVTQYLVNLGISEDMLITRYHGERYPVVPNDTADNRTRNRRVTVRLERSSEAG